ncbi:MAG: HAMP domain-containing histidine kinase [Candidatus Eremiobacteraeota bacterium]|nr:HAMP domain-containing histidine kinase [Candidatus Eremiobacteraeota bacterium]
MRHSVASRLAALYTLLLGITVLLVIVASSIALVIELAGFTNDVLFAKHEEARNLTIQYLAEGLSLKQAAPKLVDDLSGIGVRIAVYDTNGNFLGGDRKLHPRILALAVAHKIELPPAPDSFTQLGKMLEPIPSMKTAVPSKTGASPGRRLPAGDTTVGTSIYHDSEARRQLLRNAQVPTEHLSITAVDGGYIAFAPSPWLIFINLVPYWRLIITIAIAAVLVSWFIGRYFSRHALAPLNEVTQSLQALADGDYTQRRFVTARGDEIAFLTGAYNDAAASVAAAMSERRQTENRMRQFVADAGHELRTPLTVIAGYIDVLRRGAIEEPKVAKQILGTMALEKEHMRGLIDRLMRLARLDAEAPPAREPVDVERLLQNQVAAAKRLDDDRRIDYSIRDVPEILADKGELGEALWNLVENALKYAPGAAVHLSAYRNNGSTVLSVRDEGPGMSESERIHAFERFYRGDARGEIPGTGLGLAIAKRAVDRIGGTIAIDSAPGHGTTVTISL